MLRALLLAAVCASSCVVQGGEEGHQSDTAIFGVIRYEAKNQDGLIVGSGCLVDTVRKGERIHFRAAASDRIELTEHYEMIVESRAVAAEHGDDEGFWCGHKTGLPYDQPIDARCLKSVVGGSPTPECILEPDWVGKISHAELVPPDAELEPGKVLGFRLQIDVAAQGKQCAVWQCADETPSGGFVAFVIDRP